MKAISVTDTRLKLATLLSKAQQEPVMIRHNHRDIAVMLSATEYQRLIRPSARARASTPSWSPCSTPPIKTPPHKHEGRSIPLRPSPFRILLPDRSLAHSALIRRLAVAADRPARIDAQLRQRLLRLLPRRTCRRAPAATASPPQSTPRSPRSAAADARGCRCARSHPSPASPADPAATEPADPAPPSYNRSPQ